MFIHRNDPCMELSGLLGTNAPCATPLLTRDDPYVRFLLENRPCGSMHARDQAAESL
jgi:hypothetical protein